MFDELRCLAVQIAALREYVARWDDPAEVEILTPLIVPLAEIADELAEEDGVLQGDMPWWTDWRDRC